VGVCLGVVQELLQQKQRLTLLASASLDADHRDAGGLIWWLLVGHSRRWPQMRWPARIPRQVGAGNVVVAMASLILYDSSTLNEIKYSFFLLLFSVVTGFCLSGLMYFDWSDEMVI